MIVLVKEFITILTFLAAAIISRAEYAEFIVGLQSGNPADMVFLVPNMFKLIIGSFFVYFLVYTLSRWWVWRAYHKVKYRYLLIQSLLIIPFYTFLVLVIAACITVYRVFTSTMGEWTSAILFIVSTLLLYFIFMIWITFSNALSIQGKNPWYNVYDAFKHAWSKRGVNVLLVYLVPLFVSMLSTFAGLSPAFIPLSIWVSYLFARQYVVSKKKTLKLYVLHVWHSYTKTCKKAYKKVF